MPTTIASTSRIANAGAWSSRAGFGNGSFWWAVTQNTSTGKLSVWKAALGSSASEQDAANAITNFSATAPYSCHLAANGFLYVVYFTATNTIRCRRFNTSTSLWEAADVGAANIATNAVNTVNVRVVVRSDNDVIVAYNSAAATLSYARYEGSSWTVVSVSTAAAWVNDLVIDGNDRAWFSYVDNTGNDNTYRSLDSANSLGTETDYDTTAHTTDKLRGTQSIVWNDGTNNKIATLGRDSSAEIDLYHGTTGAATIGGIATVSGITTSIVPKTTSTGLVAALNRIHACWSVANDIMYDASPNLATVTFNSVDQTILTGLTDADPSPQFISNSTYIGILYQDNGSVKVEWIIEPTPVGEIVPIAVVTATSAAIAANTNINIPKPLGLADGDYVVLALASRNVADATFQVAGGTGTWVEHAHITDPQAPTGALWGKYVITAASEPANYTYQFNQTAATSAVLVVYRNVHASTPIDSAPAGSSNTGTTASESVTPSVNKARPLYASFWDASTSSLLTTWPIGYNKLAITSTNARIALYDVYQATAATTSPSDTSNTSEDWAALSLALAPAAAVSGDATGTATADSTPVTGVSATATAGLGVTGTATADATAVTAVAATGTAGTGVTGTSSVDATPITGTSTTATTGTGSTGTATAQAVPLTGTSTTGTAGASATGAATANSVAVTGVVATGTFDTSATGTASAAAVAVTGTSTTGTAGTSAEGTATADAVAVTGVAATGSAGATGTATADSVPITGVAAVGNAGASVDAVGTASPDAVAVTGTNTAANVGVGATGTATSDATPITGTLTTATAGIESTGTAIADDVPITGASATGSAGATGTADASVVSITGSEATADDGSGMGTPAYLVRGVLTAINSPLTATLAAIDPPMSGTLVLLALPFTGTLIAVDPPMQGAMHGVPHRVSLALMAGSPVLVGALEDP